MNKNIDKESVAAQIGDLGGEPQDSAIGQKLLHKSVYGQKEDLTPDEKDEMEAFLKRSNRSSQKLETFEDDREAETPIMNGWIPIDRNELGIRSQFYPEEWEFMIRPATVQAIKNWISIDEEKPEELNRVFNEIIKACVKIDTHSDKSANWTNINSWDRFWFILKVREYTFTKGEAKIEFTDDCSECDEEIVYELNSKSLFYEFPDEDLIEKYWNGNNWIIDPSEYDVDHEPITLYTPTLGKMEAVIEWATAKLQQKQKLDEPFINVVMWMIDKPSRDPQMLDRQIKKAQKEFKSWDIDMYSFMKDVITNITINQDEKLRVKCPICGGEATSQVQFPNGIKVLFQVETTAKKFGSR